MSQIRISDIVMGKRFRKDAGDVKKLADSITEVDLLHPIVIDENKQLIAGFRRIQAFKLLGRKTIPCTVISLDDCKIGELHENTVRKEFTIKEVVAIKKYVEKTTHAGRPENGGKLPPFGKGKTRDIVSELTDYSPRQINKMEKIVDAVKEKPELEHFLEEIDNHKKSVNTVHHLVTREERNLPKVPLPKGVFDVIYADPAIRFNDRGVRGSADNNYDTIPLDEIARGVFNGKNIREIIAENAVIFMWFPSSILFDETITTIADVAVSVPNYKHILNSWGFHTIKTDYVWDKQIVSPGSYSMNQHETLIMGIKGEMPVPAERFRSIYSEQRTKIHSQKPIFYYEMIEKMYPKRKYVELWAKPQVRRPHWTYWGNQAEAIPA